MIIIMTAKTIVMNNMIEIQRMSVDDDNFDRKMMTMNKILTHEKRDSKIDADKRRIIITMKIMMTMMMVTMMMMM